MNSRILLVEDETAIADTVLYALRAEGHGVVHCATAGEALRCADSQAFDLAILRIMGSLGVVSLVVLLVRPALQRRRS